MGEVLELLKSLDGPSKAAAAFLVVLVGLALRLFPNETSVRVKLVVFFALFSFAAGGLYFSGRNAALSVEAANPHAATEQAQPVAEKIGRLLEDLSPMGVALAQHPSEGWVFLGKFDQSNGRWLEGPFVTLQDASRVPRSGEALTTRGGTDVYDAEPRFNLFSQSWKLGSKVGTVNGGERLRVLAAPVFVGQNVWCRVAP